MIRLTGMASGLDTDAVIKAMMQPYQLKINNQKAKMAMLEWKSEATRNISLSLRTFKDTFMNYLKPTTNLLSATVLSGITGTVSTKGLKNLTVTPNSNVKAGTYYVKDIKTAKAATVSSSNPALSNLTSKDLTIDSQNPLAISEGTNAFEISVGGYTRTVDLSKILEDVNADITAATTASDGSALDGKTLLDTTKFDFGSYDSDVQNAIIGKINERIKYNEEQYVEAKIDNGKISFVNGNDENGNPYDYIAFTVNGTNGNNFSSSFGLTTNSNVTNSIAGTGSLDFIGSGDAANPEGITFDDTNNKFKISVTRVNSIKEFDIEIDPKTYNNIDELQAAIQEKMTELGVGVDITIEKNSNGDGLEFVVADGKNLYVSLSDTYTTLDDPSDPDNSASTTASTGALGILGFNEGDSTKNTNSITMDNVGVKLTPPNSRFQATLNGVTEVISVKEGDYTDIDDFKDAIQDALDEKFGAGRVEVKVTGDKIEFAPSITDTFKVSDVEGYGFLENVLGTDASLSNKAIPATTTLKDLGVDLAKEFTINGEKIEGLTEDTTVASFIKKVNDISGVKMSYNELSNSFTIETNDVGVAASLEITAEADSVLDRLGFATTQTPVKGSDATMQFSTDGQTWHNVQRSTNNFTFNDMTFTLKEDSAVGDVIDFEVKVDVEKPMQAIKDFVTAYNNLLDQLNGAVSEKKYKDYQPLTDEEKDELDEKTIEKYEEKAKSGILRNDNNINALIRELRSSISASVQGAGIRLEDIGIKTGTWEKGGKLEINEDTLRQALETNGDAITKLFTTISEVDRTDTSSNGMSKRFSENGLAQRLADIMDRYAGTYNGEKGILLKSAGIEGDTTSGDNAITKQLEKQQKYLNELELRMQNMEDRYYLKFSKLETLMSQLQSQQTWLSQQLGTGG